MMLTACHSSLMLWQCCSLLANCCSSAGDVLFCRRCLAREIFVDEMLYILVCHCFMRLINSANTFFRAADTIGAIDVLGMPV